MNKIVIDRGQRSAAQGQKLGLNLRLPSGFGLSHLRKRGLRLVALFRRQLPKIDTDRDHFGDGFGRVPHLTALQSAAHLDQELHELVCSGVIALNASGKVADVQPQQLNKALLIVQGFCEHRDVSPPGLATQDRKLIPGFRQLRPHSVQPVLSDMSIFARGIQIGKELLARVANGGCQSIKLGGHVGGSSIGITGSLLPCGSVLQAANDLSIEALGRIIRRAVQLGMQILRDPQRDSGVPVFAFVHERLLHQNSVTLDENA